MAERWERIEELLDQALALPPTARGAFLATIYGGDRSLAWEVESLLAADAAAGAFLTDSDQDLERSFAPGQHLGPYEIERELGRGGTGIVLLGRKAADPSAQKVALKVPRPGLCSPAAATRLRTESSILARLDHPNLARFHGTGTAADGTPFFVMEHIEGLRIDQHCEHHQLPTAKRLELVVQVCAAVEVAHRHGIVHRDIKPSNILVQPDGVPKLLDFGIAKPLTSAMAAGATGLTATGVRVLTPPYASPEQLLGRPLGPVSDVYSLGVLLHLLLTDRLPGSERAPQKEAPAGHLGRIVAKALELEPRRRYRSARALAAQLRRYLAGRSGSRAPFGRLSNAWAGPLAGALFLTLAATFPTVDRQLPAPAQPPVTVASAARCIPDGGFDDTLRETDCCSGRAIAGSIRCLDPADFGTSWKSCVQTCA